MNSSNYPDVKQSFILIILFFGFFCLFFLLTALIPPIFNLQISEVYLTLVFSFASPIAILPLIYYVSKKSGNKPSWSLKIPRVRIILLLVILAISTKILTYSFSNLKEFAENLIDGRIKIGMLGLSEFNLIFMIRFVGIVLIVPIFEEIFWRKQILGLLLNKYSPLISILLSSVLFSVAHLELNGIASLFIWGLLFGIVYHQTGSLESSIFLHSLSNLTTFILKHKFVEITGLVIFKFVLILMVCLLIIFLILRYFKSANFRANYSGV